LYGVVQQQQQRVSCVLPMQEPAEALPALPAMLKMVDTVHDGGCTLPELGL
jgi:hypothetical protein